MPALRKVLLDLEEVTINSTSGQRSRMAAARRKPSMPPGRSIGEDDPDIRMTFEKCDCFVGRAGFRRGEA